MHGRKGRLMTNFEEVLTQYEPMISATLRKLHIYRDHENFRQAGRVALWQAWTRYDETKGHFAPYASRSIRGAMLDLLRAESRVDEHVVPMEDEIVEVLQDVVLVESEGWSDRIATAFSVLNANERIFIQWYFVEGLSQEECAERAGISIAGIKKRRERLLVKLRKVLQTIS